jgi:hypothetical protein
MNPGGLLETCATATTRPRPSLTLPDRGPFSFPAPYGTTGIRITNAADMDGADALWYCGYSYWANMNAHVGQSELLIFLGVDRQRGGAGPSLWSVDKATDAVTPRGPIFPPAHALSWSTAEGWHWSATSPTILYATDETHLYRVDVAPVLAGSGPATLTTVVDVGRECPGRMGWQWHTSQDGRTHSATLKRASTYAVEGACVYVEGDATPWREYPARGAYDECQIDQSGLWLVTKDNVDNRAGEDNLIYELWRTSEPRLILDEEGAAGHSDNGFGYMVAADNWNAQPSAFRVWMLDAGAQPQGRLVYYTPSWDAQLGHLSHCNARGEAPDGQYVVGSGASRTAAPRNNEVIAFRLDGSFDVLVIAPVLTDLDAPGGGSDDYAKLPKGNVDVTGEYFLWTTNLGGPRLDALLVKVPAQLLVNGSDPTPPPSQPTWTVTAPDGSTRRFVEVS